SRRSGSRRARRPRSGRHVASRPRKRSRTSCATTGESERQMALYVDTSALLKRYIDEADSELSERHLLADPLWITARHTLVEVRRNLARLLNVPLQQGAGIHVE